MLVLAQFKPEISRTRFFWPVETRKKIDTEKEKFNVLKSFYTFVFINPFTSKKYISTI